MCNCYPLWLNEVKGKKGERDPWEGVWGIYSQWPKWRIIKELDGGGDVGSDDDDDVTAQFLLTSC